MATQTRGEYRIKHHLEEIVALLGPLPRRLLAQGNQRFVAEYFDEHGQVRNPITRPAAMLENWLQSLDGKEKATFVAFLKSMKIDPECRASSRSKNELRHYF